jgi:membrane protein required for colicin V production
MEGFTLVDGGSAIILLISAILAYSRGLVREILSIAGWVAAAIAAFIFAPRVEPLIREIPILSDIIGESCELSIIAAFAAVFAITLIVVAIFTPLFAGAVQRSALSGFDQGLGFLFGVLRGVALILVALVAYNFIGADLEIVENSKTKEILAGSEAQIQEAIEKDGEAGQESLTAWAQNRYQELTTSCSAKTEDNTPKVTTPVPTGN